VIGFKEFFYQEAMTSTANIAGFARITLPLVTRQWVPEMDWGQPKKKRKQKVKDQPQLKESKRNLG
jgi:hypothetical protein